MRTIYIALLDYKTREIDITVARGRDEAEAITHNYKSQEGKGGVILKNDRDRDQYIETLSKSCGWKLKNKNELNSLV